MRTLRSEDGALVLVTHVERDGDPNAEHGIRGPMLLDPGEVAALRSGFSDQVFITLKSGREYEVEGALDELEAAFWPNRTEESALVNFWTGERSYGQG